MASTREAPESGSTELQALLDFLKDSRGFDFSGYKRAALRRRIEKRMQAVRVEGFPAYQDFLEANPREFTDLFNTILINVTAFFRDDAAWDCLRKEVVPAIVAETPANGPIRIWSAGCASGEEAYSAAILFAEEMGEDDFKRRVKVYATDLDEDALMSGRHATYPNDSLKAMPDELVSRYFEPTASGMQFRSDLRRSVIFGRNDLITDAPISQIDLLICRNVLMYFTAETQASIVDRLNFALKPAGFLFVGKSEMLIAHGHLFAPHSLKWRVFRNIARDRGRERLGFVASKSELQHERYADIRRRAAGVSPIAQLVVDRNGVLADATPRARQLFALGAADLGRPFHDLTISYRPADLRSAIERAYETGAPVRVGAVQYEKPGGEARMYEVEVAPVPGTTGTPVAASVVFTDITAVSELTEHYERSRREVETAYEELQSTLEELETTNEELQSTNEELETTNEELQSTNEELETMNEELQSTNDELETMNSEVNVRAGQLDRVNVFLEGILSTLGAGVVVIDRAREVQVWNEMSTELWGLRADEAAGKDLFTLDIGLDLGALTESVATALRGARADALTLRAVNRRGREFHCRVAVTPLRGSSGEVYGALVLTEPIPGDGELAAAATPVS